MQKEVFCETEKKLTEKKKQKENNKIFIEKYLQLYKKVSVAVLNIAIYSYRLLI